MSGVRCLGREVREPGGQRSRTRSREHLFELLAGDPRGIGYVLSRLLAPPRHDSPLETLTERELAVLALMAEARSNQAIASQLFMSPKTVETPSGTCSPSSARCPRRKITAGCRR